MNTSVLNQTAQVHTAGERARLKNGVHIELSPRRVRAFYDKQLMADSERVLLVFESMRQPVYWFPTKDVRMDRLEPEGRVSEARPGVLRWHSNDGSSQGAILAWSYARPEGDLAPLEGHIALYWNAMDSWFEEDEEVFVHPRDPYTRVDAVHSSRHVRVEIDGTLVADTERPVLVFETGLPTRYYIPKLDVRMDLLQASDTVTHCPYKGTAAYWSIHIGGKTHPDIVWSYPRPLPEIPKIENLLSFYNEKVDLFVDGVLQERSS